MSLNQNQLYFKVFNTRDDDELTYTHGVGLTNIKRQLELIYGKNHTLSIQPQAHSFTTELTIQLKAND